VQNFGHGVYGADKRLFKGGERYHAAEQWLLKADKVLQTRWSMTALTPSL
jgi:hypothetical protein